MYYVGKTIAGEEVFYSKQKPTKEKYPEYSFVVGPYKSRVEAAKKHQFLGSASHVWRDSKGRVIKREVI